MQDPQSIGTFNPNQPHHHFYCLDIHQRMISCNDQQAIDVGLECEAAFIGKHLDAGYTQNNIDVFVANNEKIIRDGIAQLIYEPTDIIYKEKPITFASYKMPLRNARGKIIGITGMSTPAMHYSDDNNHLTHQQKKCIHLLLKGFSPKQIAAEMQLSYKTIEHYLAKIRTKLQCKTTRELILKIK